MDSLGASLEAEQKSKAEALRIKKKLESDINELEIAEGHPTLSGPPPRHHSSLRRRSPLQAAGIDFFQSQFWPETYWTKSYDI
jgi:hypothetical protein